MRHRKNSRGRQKITFSWVCFARYSCILCLIFISYAKVTPIRDAVAVERIYLFGSYAYGTPDANSDYDFYVVLSDEAKPHEAISTIYHALHRMKDRASVDILALSAERFDDRKRLLTLERKVANEGVLLYEQGRPDFRMA